VEKMPTKKHNQNTRTILSFALVPAIALVFGACQAAPQNDNAKQLKELHAKVDGLHSKIDKLAKSRPGARQAPKRPKVGQLYKVPVTQEDSYRGGKHAKVTIALATEFACPYCAKLAPVVEELLKEYNDDELKVVSKQFVIHPQTATLPALAGCAAHKQGKFGAFEDRLWQKAWHSGDTFRLNKDALAQPALDAIAQELKLDLKRFQADMNGPCKTNLSKGRQELSRLGVGGTPAIYINGVFYGGQRSADALKIVIDDELKKAEAALSKGTKLEDYYASLIAKGKATL
jgi:protein-disulfide isomerase